jgi:luciferase family oxidoreductase group 1
VWLLGSSGFSAQLAGELGLPFAFAHHFSHENTLPALQLYRSSFRPSSTLERPHVMVAAIVVAADTQSEALRLALPGALSFLRLRQGLRGPTPTCDDAQTYPWTPSERIFAEDWLTRNVVGVPAAVRTQVDALLAATRADELMVLCTAPDPAARQRSYAVLRDLYPV